MKNVHKDTLIIMNRQSVFPFSDVQKSVIYAMIYTIGAYSRLCIFVCSVFLFGIGCMDSRVQSTNDLPGSQLRGSVRLLSEDNSFAINKSLVLVKLEGTGFETLTDTAGRWTLNLVPKGTYTIVYSKPGYTLAKRFGIRSDGAMPVVLNQMTLVQNPPFIIDSMSCTVQSDSVTILCRINQTANMMRRAILYIDSMPIDPNQRNRYVFTDIGLIVQPGTSIGSITLPLSRFYNSGFVSGSTVYCLGLSIIRFEATPDESYFAIDPMTKKTIFWNVNALGASSQFALP